MENEISVLDDIKNKIYTIRGQQVMLDTDLANLYGVETKNLNRAVSRNIGRFPERFRFQLTQNEFIEYEKTLRFQFGTLDVRSKFDTSNRGRGQYRKYLPHVFTEQGVSMLSAVLRSETAVLVSIQIIDAFVGMRKFIASNALMFQRLDSLEKKQLETDGKFEEVFKAIEAKEITPSEGIFYDGQVYDAYSFVSKLIKSAQKSIILIDNYIDDTVLTQLTKRNKNCSATIYTKSISKQLKLDLKKHNQQYPKIQITQFTKSHDRFLIIDNKTIYHLGASLKDLGKKWFAFTKMSSSALELINQLP